VTDINDRVAGYRGLVESVASRYRSRHILADEDDLIQEGLIAVWHALEKGIEPGPDYIRNRMKDYVRKLNRPSRHEETVEYNDELGTARSPYTQREKEYRLTLAQDVQ
jgi:DNA-directed RNA polymerase specialized sigma subunit